MDSLQKDLANETVEKEEAVLKAFQMQGGFIFTMVLKTALELELFDRIASAGGGPDAQLSAADIAFLLPTKNPQAPAMLDRMLQLLASFSIFNCKVVTDLNGGNPQRLYSLSIQAKMFVKNQDGISLAPFLLLTCDKVFMEAWFGLKDAILEGGVPFDRAFGINAFEYPARDSRFNEVYNKGMISLTSQVMKRFLEVYKGFEGVKELVDVGGGLGATSAAIVSEYPDLRAINFDLPHVIQSATPQNGVEHIAGDMFESVPTAEMILMKHVLHDWSDEHCLKILKNCFKALPESGKLVIVENILPECPDGTPVNSIALQFDLGMLVMNPGGKERTQREFQFLAKDAGFASINLSCRAYADWVIEFYKT